MSGPVHHEDAVAVRQRLCDGSVEIPPVAAGPVNQHKVRTFPPHHNVHISAIDRDDLADRWIARLDSRLAQVGTTVDKETEGNREGDDYQGCRQHGAAHDTLGSNKDASRQDIGYWPGLTMAQVRRSVRL